MSDHRNFHATLIPEVAAMLLLLEVHTVDLRHYNNVRVCVALPKVSTDITTTYESV